MYSGEMAGGAQASRTALVQADHPWNDADLARLYDAFPFEDDLPLYLDLAGSQGESVLEWACGSGRVLIPLARAGNRVTGVDISSHMLALAREKLEREGQETRKRVQLIQGDMRATDVGRQFDLAIIAVKSFAYLTQREEQLQALCNVARHLRPGGLLAMDLLNPDPRWLLEEPGSLRQDLVEHVPDEGFTLARTEAVVNIDLAAQVRTIRSIYEVVADDCSVTKRFVEWPYRFTYRFEAEHLLERAGFEIEAVYGGYRCEPFTSDSRVMLFLARKR